MAALNNDEYLPCIRNTYTLFNSAVNLTPHLYAWVVPAQAIASPVGTADDSEEKLNYKKIAR